MGSYITFSAPCPQCNKMLSFQDKVLLESDVYDTCYWPRYEIGTEIYEAVKDVDVPVVYGWSCGCPGIFIARIRDGIFQGFDLKQMSGGQAALMMYQQRLICRCGIPREAENFDSLYLEMLGPECRLWLRPRKRWARRPWTCISGHPNGGVWTESEKVEREERKIRTRKIKRYHFHRRILESRLKDKFRTMLATHGPVNKMEMDQMWWHYMYELIAGDMTMSEVEGQIYFDYNGD